MCFYVITAQQKYSIYRRVPRVRISRGHGQRSPVVRERQTQIADIGERGILSAKREL